MPGPYSSIPASAILAPLRFIVVRMRRSAMRDGSLLRMTGRERVRIIVLARHKPSEVCIFSLFKKREVERRQALGCIGTR
jgi:hypothetical protein